MRALRPLAGLVKPRIAGAAAFSAFSAFVAASGGFAAGAVAVSAGVFLLACGSCALNEWQERGTDALMLRTRLRPIPSGSVAPAAALGLCAFLLAAGSALLFTAAGAGASLLGLAAAAWYNGVYTPLKRRSAFAAAPGALVGAAPPCLGWLAAGGGLGDPRLLAVCLFFYLWQVPHFWLLAPGQEADLKAAGLPAAAETLGRRRITRVAGVWLAAAAGSTVLFPLFGTLRSLPAFALLGAAACLLTWKAGLLAGGEARPAALRRIFVEVNLYALLVMGLLCADPLLAAF